MFGGKPKNDSDPIRNPNAGTKHGVWTKPTQAQKAGRWTKPGGK